MRFATVFLLLLVAVAGCKHPVKAITHSYVETDTPPIKDPAPVIPMQVEGNPSCSKIALIDVDGVLVNQNLTGLSSMGENPVDAFREKLDRVARTPCVSAVVIRINSPGGSVTATDIMWRDLNSFKQRTGLPVIACIMDVGAGGGYYLATAADHIVAHPTSLTGGIGVILNVYNLQGAMELQSIVSTPVKSGELTDIGTSERPMTEQSQKILQTLARGFHTRFRDIVRGSRGLELKNDSVVFDGRVFAAQDALDKGLIDSSGYLDDALQLARNQAGTPDAATVIFHRKKDRARTPYAITPNSPVQGDIVPLSIPGLDRSKLPAFLYMWQPESTIVP